MNREKFYQIHGSRPLLLFALAFPLLAAPAYGNFKVEPDHSQPKSYPKMPSPAASKNEPVLLAADEVHYDQPSDTVTASGHVEITQGETIILADRLIYNQATDMLRASGNISMLESSGNVYFADEMELSNELKAGVVNDFKAHLSDDSRFVAAGARKIDELHTELFKAAYTPCKCDRDGAPKTPMWQIRSDYAFIDREEQEIRYNDATFDFYNVPIMYMPYFSHPTPDADNQSGLLTPSFMHSTNLGGVFKQPVYYAMAPDKDITLTPIYTSLAGPVMAGEYRQLFDAGPLLVDGSITSAPNRDGAGNSIPGHELRGHFDAKGQFKIDENYDWGLDVHRASDETYLRLYNFSGDTLLTSRVYAEGFNFIDDNDRTYGSVQGLSFQGLTGQDISKLVPVVMPLTDVTWQSNPGLYNSRFTADGDLMALYRQTGSESRRLSGSVGWKLPYISDDGQLIEFNTQLRTDIYNVNSLPLPDGRTYDGVTGREMPQMSVLWHYPFINRFGTSSVMLEPVVEMDASAGGTNQLRIPNEDSQVPEFNDTNLFSPNRFPGLDRVENGSGVSYGMRGQAQLFSDKFVDWLLGQHYRLYDDKDFPFTNDPNSRLSDYVGHVGLSSAPFTVAYRFRLDRESLIATRSEVDASMNLYPVTFSTSYLSLKDDPVLADRQTVTGTAALNLTREWSWNINGTRDLLLNQTNTAYTGVSYKNECVTLTTMVGKDYTDLLDIKPSLTFWFRVSLKNLD